MSWRSWNYQSFIGFAGDFRKRYSFSSFNSKTFILSLSPGFCGCIGYFKDCSNFCNVVWLHESTYMYMVIHVLRLLKPAFCRVSLLQNHHSSIVAASRQYQAEVHCTVAKIPDQRGCKCAVVVIATWTFYLRWYQSWCSHAETVTGRCLQVLGEHDRESCEERPGSREIDYLIDELENYSDSDADADTISVLSTPKPKLR